VADLGMDEIRRLPPEKINVKRCELTTTILPKLDKVKYSYSFELEVQGDSLPSYWSHFIEQKSDTVSSLVARDDQGGLKSEWDGHWIKIYYRDAARQKKLHFEYEVPSRLTLVRQFTKHVYVHQDWVTFTDPVSTVTVTLQPPTGAHIRSCQPPMDSEGKIRYDRLEPYIPLNYSMIFDISRIPVAIIVSLLGVLFTVLIADLLSALLTAYSLGPLVAGFSAIVVGVTIAMLYLKAR